MRSAGDNVEIESANPFSTRFIRPGAVSYVFVDGEDANTLVSRLAGLGWWAQVVGPHGSGKSTLIAHLVEPLERAGHRAAVFALRDGQRRLPRGWEADVAQRAAGMVVIDGYEQLSYFSRWWVAWRCCRRRWGLLVTAHHDVGFPTLLRTASSLATAQAVVDQLLGDNDRGIDHEAVAESYAGAGSVRETLFALYDRYEKR